MKTFTKILALAVLAGAATILFVGCANDGHALQGHLNGPATKSYPRNICLVTDQAFKHGKRYTFVYDGQEIKLCCESCFTDFKRNPAMYLARFTAPE